MNYKKLLALIIIAFGFQSHAQKDKDIYLSEILEEALFSGKDTVKYAGVNIKQENGFLPSDTWEDNNFYSHNWHTFFSERYPNKILKQDTSGNLIIPAALHFMNITGKEISLRGLTFENSFFLQSDSIQFFSMDNSYQDFALELSNVVSMTLMGDRFTGGLYIAISDISDVSNFTKLSPLDRFMIVENQFSIQFFTEYRYLTYAENICGEKGEYHDASTGSFISINHKDSDLFFNANIFENHEPQLKDSAYLDLSFSGKKNNKFRSNLFEDMQIRLFADYEEFVLSNNDFYENVFFGGYAFQQFDLDYFTLVDNKFRKDFQALDIRITSSAKIIDNEFNRFYFRNLTLPETSLLDFDFDQLKGNKIFYSEQEFCSSDGKKNNFETKDELSQKKPFLQAIKLYSKIYRSNKEVGNIQSANDTFYELSALYTRRYAALHANDPSLNTWFKWRLNQLLGYYIGYGTDPAKALVISLYIILLFSIFYFFFPSEWDVSSKSKILKNMKLTINKNEPKTFQTLIKAVALLFLSFLNAFTLSMNSFVTLGFGNIPTKGLARYVCIVQGFMGWFLLSLFSVALINQVIF